MRLIQLFYCTIITLHCSTGFSSRLFQSSLAFFALAFPEASVQEESKQTNKTFKGFTKNGASMKKPELNNVKLKYKSFLQFFGVWIVIPVVLMIQGRTLMIAPMTTIIEPGLLRCTIMTKFVLHIMTCCPQSYKPVGPSTVPPQTDSNVLISRCFSITWIF